MTARVTMTLVVGAVVAATVAAGAQDFGGRQGGRPGGRGMGPMGSVLATALDTNRDNAISATEIDGAPGVLKTMDRNGDGRLAGEELMPAMGPGGRGPGGREGGEREGGREGGGREGRGGNMAEPGETPATSPDELAAMLMTFDRNRDGNLDKSEVPERMLGIFDRADVNKDGKVNADENKKSASSTRQLNEMGGREGFGREGREGGGREGFGREGRGPGAMADRLMTALDTNKDGVISAEEMAAAPTALRTLDANKDGQLTADEFRQPVRIG